QDTDMIPLKYNHRNLRVRWKTTLMTASGFTLVVAALVVILAFVNGLRAVCTVSGQPENVLVLSRGSADEDLSEIPRATVSQIEVEKGVARDASGQLLASQELFCGIFQKNLKTGVVEVLQCRGIRPVAAAVHSQFKMEQGQMFRPRQQ